MTRHDPNTISRSAPDNKSEQTGKPLSLRHNFSWNFVGNVVYAACQWGMLVVLAKLTSPEQVGLFSLGLAITAPIFLFSQLQLRGVQATDARDEYQFSHYLGLRLLTTLIAVGIVGTVVGIGSYERETTWVILAVALSKVFESISDVFYGLMQKQERMDRIALSRIIKGTFSLLALGFGVWFSGKVLWGVLAMAVVWGGVLCTFDLYNGVAQLSKYCKQMTLLSVAPYFHLRRLLHIALLALPLGLVSALVSLKTNIPKYFIEIHLGKESLGIFSALFYLVTAAGMIVIAMGQAVIPRLSQLYSCGKYRAYIQLLMLLLGLGVCIAGIGICVVLVAGEFILGLIYGKEYMQERGLLLWMIVGGGISYLASFCGCAILAARKFFVQLPIMAFSALSTLYSALILVPNHGMRGGAVSFLIGNTTTLLLQAIVLIFILKDRIDFDSTSAIIGINDA